MAREKYSKTPINQNVKGIHVGAGVTNISLTFLVFFFLVKEEKDSFKGPFSPIG